MRRFHEPPLYLFSKKFHAVIGLNPLYWKRHLLYHLFQKKDGEIIVRGSGPKILKGKTEVIDDVRRGRAEIKGKFDDKIEN